MNVKRILTKEEISFLLKGGDHASKSRESPQGFQLLEALAGLFPHRRMALVIVLLCMSVIPLLGGSLFRQTYGERVDLILWVITAIAGFYLVLRHSGPGLEGMVAALKAGMPPDHKILQRLLRALAGLMLIMPGPVVNILACLLLLPPISRMVAIVFRRKIEGYLDKTKEPL